MLVKSAAVNYGYSMMDITIAQNVLYAVQEGWKQVGCKFVSCLMDTSD